MVITLISSDLSAELPHPGCASLADPLFACGGKRVWKGILLQVVVVFCYSESKLIMLISFLTV